MATGYTHNLILPSEDEDQFGSPTTNVTTTSWYGENGRELR